MIPPHKLKTTFVPHARTSAHTCLLQGSKKASSIREKRGNFFCTGLGSSNDFKLRFICSEESLFLKSSFSPQSATICLNFKSNEVSRRAFIISRWLLELFAPVPNVINDSVGLIPIELRIAFFFSVVKLSLR